MAYSVVPESYRPDWAYQRAAALPTMVDNGLANVGDQRDEPEIRVHEFSGMTPASAARRLERIRAERDLLDFVEQGGIPELVGDRHVPQGDGAPKLQFVGEERGLGPSMLGSKPLASDEPTQPNSDQSPSPTTQPAPAPAPQATPAPQPAPAPAQPSASQPAPVPGSDPFGLPDTEGKVEGDEWDTTLPDGRIVHNRIPFGNGNRTVDQTIPDGKGGFTRSRVAAGENGGWQRWNVNADGTAFYGNKQSADSGMVGYDYGAATPTTWRPDRAYVTTPDYKGVQNPSYDENGILVGVDVAVPNEYGLYDNYHYDLYNNLTISRASPDGKGGVDSAFIGQFDSNGEGWEIDKLGYRWDVGKDLLGRPTKGRTEYTDEGTHIYFVDHRGVLFDSFYGNADNPSYTDTYNPDETITRRLRDGTEITFGPDLTITKYKSPRDRRDIVEKGVDGLVDVGRSLESWGSDFAQIFNYGAGLRAAANPTDPAYRAAAEHQATRAFSAYAAAGNFIIDSAVYPVVTVYDWGRYTLGGAFHGLTGDPFTPAGQARLQGAQEYTDKAPSTAETLLAATTFLMPEFGVPARAGAAVAHTAAAEATTVGRRALSSGVGALGSEGAPLGTRWLTTAGLPRNWAAFNTSTFTNSTLAASTSAPRGIIRLDVIPSGTRALTAADLPLISSSPSTAEIFGRDLFTGTSVIGRRTLDLPEKLLGGTRVPSEGIFAEATPVFDPRRLGIDTFPLTRSSQSPLAASEIPERQLVSAGRDQGATAAEHHVDIILQDRSVRVLNSAPSGTTSAAGSGAPRPAVRSSSASASSSSGTPLPGGGSGGTRPPSGGGGTSSGSVPPGRLLIGYKPPKAIRQPPQKLSPKEFTALGHPGGGRPTLLADTHYIHIDRYGRKTELVTGPDGAPIYIDTWGSRTPAGKGTSIASYNRILDHPLPNAVYRVNKDFLVRIDKFGRPIEGYNARLRIAQSAERTRSDGRQSRFLQMVRRTGVLTGRELDAGHSFRAEFASPAEFLFYTPQRRRVNQAGGEFYAMENEIEKILKATAGNPTPGRVEYSILKIYDKNPTSIRRPAGDEYVPLKYDVAFREAGTYRWMEREIFNV